jgi:ABC-type lipoprotein release transport system permease subunit
VIRLGLRLTLRSGREATVRLVLTALAVALGVAMLLITFSAINGVNSQNARWSWLQSRDTPASATPAGVAPLWWHLGADEFHGTLIGRLDVAPTGPHSPALPGIARLPKPGEIYASPAMARLLTATPTAQLAARYPGKVVGIIATSALPAPDTLIVVIGGTPAEVSAMRDAQHITQIATTPPSSCNGQQCLAVGIDARGIDLVLAVTIAALLFPVMIFIGTATRLSAARREQRFAAMRLVGATPRQVAAIAAVESTSAAVVGVALGLVAFLLLRPVLAQIPFTGSKFFESDLTVTSAQLWPVLIGVPVGAAVVARLALRRVVISPLGVSRRVTPKPPRAWRLLPLVAGLGELTFFVAVGRPPSTPGQIQAFTSGIVITMMGLVVAGPWLAMVGARLLARRAERPEVLIAGRRMSDNPQAAFRAISGLVLALFVASIAIGMITTIDAYDGPLEQGYASRLLFADLTPYWEGPDASPSAPLPAGLTAQLHAVPGVTTVTVVRDDGSGDSRFDYTGVVSCHDLAALGSLGQCVPGATTGTISRNLTDHRNERVASSKNRWPAAPVSESALARLPVDLVVVGTDGSQAAIEKSRTLLEAAYPSYDLPTTITEAEASTNNAKLDAEYRQLVDVVVLCSMVVAGCSLAVSVVTGLTDRRRPFSLLRLSGAQLSVLRRVLLLESAVPLLVVSLASVAVGFFSAYLFLRAQLQEQLQWPHVSYYVVVGIGVVVALAVTVSTLPLLPRMTGPEAARNE